MKHNYGIQETAAKGGKGLKTALLLSVLALAGLAAMWTATEKAAFEYGFQPALGKPLFVTGGFAAAFSTFVSFALTPVYLSVLRRRDAANKETSGFTLTIVAMVVAVAIFAAAALLLAGPGGTVGAGW